jgi:hypothetical protein
MDILGEIIVPMSDCDHRGICLFAGKKSSSYRSVLNVLRDWAEEEKKC